MIKKSLYLHICRTIHIYTLTVACIRISVIRYGIMLRQRSYQQMCLRLLIY